MFCGRALQGFSPAIAALGRSGQSDWPRDARLRSLPSCIHCGSRPLNCAQFPLALAPDAIMGVDSGRLGQLTSMGHKQILVRWAASLVLGALLSMAVIDAEAKPAIVVSTIRPINSLVAAVMDG